MLKIRSAKIRDKFSFLMLCSSYGFWILFQCVPPSLRFIIKQLGCLLRYYFDSWHLAFQSEFVIFCNSIKRATKLLKTISFQRRNYPVRSADNRLEYQPSHFFEHFHCGYKGHSLLHGVGTWYTVQLYSQHDPVLCRFQSTFLTSMCKAFWKCCNSV